MDEALLRKVISKREIDALKNIIIFREDNGEYNIYDRYTVNRNVDNTYTVNVLGTYTEKNFYKLKNAVAWCSFDKRGSYKDANRLHQLDQLIFGMDTEIQIHTGLIKKASNEELKLIYLSKLTQEKAKKRNFITELNHFLTEFKRWQDGLFAAKPKY